MTYKILFTVLVFSLSLGNSKAQQLSKTWVSYYGGAGTKVTASQYEPISNRVYICGVTTDTAGIATANSFKPQFGPYASTLDIMYKKEVFIACFDTVGNRKWATYYGGEKWTFLPSLSVDPVGNIYLSGVTESKTGIASANGFYNTVDSNGFSGFFAKFNPQGQRLWASYYSMPQGHVNNGTTHIGWRIAFDAMSNVYLCGSTLDNTGIATLGSHQDMLDTARLPLPPPFAYTDWPFKGDAFLVKFDPNGNRLWGTYYGGNGQDYAVSVSVKGAAVYLLGMNTFISDTGTAIATIGAYQHTYLPNNSNGFLAKFDTAGNRLWGTYIHGELESYLINVKADEWGNVYVYGLTQSHDSIASTGTHQASMSGLNDAFLMKFNAQGQKVWGTYFGGLGVENYVFSEAPLLTHTSQTLIVAPEGGIYIAGATTSPNGIATDCTIETTQGNGGFIAKFDTSGQLLMGSYYDAPISDISLDGKGNIYFSSWSILDSLASSGTFLSTKPPGQNAGIFGKLKQKYVCPTDSIANLNIVQNTLVADTGYLQYKWYKNGNIIGTTSNNVFPISDSGAYHVAVLGSCDCLYLSDTIPYSSLVITKLGLYNSIKLSPNPAKDNLVLMGEAKNSTAFSYRIVNTLGKELQAGTFKANGTFAQGISIENLPAGLYFLQLRDKSGWGSLKFVKE